MYIKRLLEISLAVVALAACNGLTPSEQTVSLDNLPVASELKEISFSSDKARYNPGDEVVFTSSVSKKDLGIRYWHLGEVIEENFVSNTREWKWTPPANDFKGYMAELVGKDADGKLVSLGTCAVDVSSDWTRFPRYGYLGTFCNAPNVKREKVISKLNRHHINGLQYYEWAYDHHHPLCGTPENPEPEWDKYLTGSTCQLEVIQGYIKLGHDHNIASMFYDLNNGVFEWCEQDGCGSTWYTYTDKNHTNKDYHPLDVPPFRSNLYLVDPSLDAWLEYFARQIDDVYKVFDFDGFHIDQLGNRGKIYDYNGNPVYLPDGYAKMIKAMKTAQPDKILAFNAVSGWGQKEIASAPVSFLYNEVWDTNYGAIKRTLDENRAIDPSRNTVLAAYMHSANDGYFNIPAVLLTEAVMFAMGASHIELGETLICDIYWPACKMKLKPELELALVKYYDFLTAYENILRDGGKEFKLKITSSDIPVTYWEPSQGSVNVYGSQKDGKIMIHLLNFCDAVHMNWRDDKRNQAEPKAIEEFSITVPTIKAVKKVWAASPDIAGGAPQELEFKENQAKTAITVTVPYLKYWTMIVVE